MHAAAAASGCPVHVSERAAEFDPFGDGYQQDPPEYVRWAREQEPVFYSPKLGYWVVTRYDDIKAIFRDNITPGSQRRAGVVRLCDEPHAGQRRRAGPHAAAARADGTVHARSAETP
ncbi:hypothetical protein G6F22_020933 [Rhizopus arrhizus]|nr:hypothetical protein G6F22_020933 [Rhizopus arrhizus]